MQQRFSFTSGSIVKSMLRFVGPYILGVIVQNLYGAVDLLVVGHFATTADVSAVTIGSQLMSMATQLIIGFATGTTVLIGQFFGAKNNKNLSKTTGSSITIFLIFGVVLTAAFLILCGPIVTLMQTPAEAVAATNQYLFVCSLGIVFIAGYNIINSILMGLGDTKTPFVFILTACIINVVLDIILVRFFYMGALGAAIATSVAQAGSVLFALLYLRKKGLGFSLKKTDIRLNKDFTGKIIKIGAPVAVQNALVGASFLFITAIINQMGLTASAAVGVVEKLMNFLFIPSIAFGAAVSTISAQNLGAGNKKRARQSMWHGIWMALIPSCIIAVFCQFGGEILTGLFTNNTYVLQLSALYLKSYIIDCVLVSFIFCMNGFFNSSGKSWFTLLHSIFTTFAMRVPLSFLFSRIPDTSLYLIGWAAPLSSLVSMILCLFYFAVLSRKKTANSLVE